MNLIQTNQAQILSKLAAMPKGKSAGLVEIFGADWESIGLPGIRKEFGRQFKVAVLNNQFPDVEWVRIENSGRYDVYRRI